MITKLICWFSNYIVGDKNLKRNFKSIDGWKELIARNNVKLIALKRFYPYVIKTIPTKNIVIVLEKTKK